jgi:CDP-glycerol glycerophosphotransferase
VARDAYPAYVALQESLAARRALRRRKARLARRARAAQMKARYHAQLRRPLDPQLAAFAAYWFRGYSCNPRAIYEKARELAPDVRGVWVVHADAAGKLPPGVEHVVARTPEYYDLIARAKFCVNNVNWPDDLVKRAGSVHVMTHHGTPLKRMGLDERLSPATKMDFAALMRRCARWDYSVSANPHTTLVWERVYPLPYETLETGYPRNDVLATATDDDVRRARERLGVEPGQVAVLYAPTHRDHQTAHEPVLDVEAVAEALGPGHVVLDRTHYFYAGRAGRLARDVTDHPSVEELCLAADVLVTDYSSIMFDYAVLDRPILIHAPDWEVYRAVRGTYFDLLAEPPGVVARTQDELIAALAAGADDAAARAAFRERFCALEDGRAAERVVRRVFLSEREATARPAPDPVGRF